MAGEQRLNARRRALLQALAAAGLVPGCASPPRVDAPGFVRDPFALGVAAGYPGPDGITLWTRLMLDSADAGMAASAIPVRWEIAADAQFHRILTQGSIDALPGEAHSVHVDIGGLGPARWYHYRFHAGAATSRSGRFLTAPAPGTMPAGLKLAFASCQQYEQGYFAAHRHIAADEPELVVFLGDYIYESSWGRSHVRKHDAPEPYTLAEYRARHALYKGDTDLQAAHATCAWLVTWDDHEVDNDYANDRPEDGMPAPVFLARRAAAYQAYYEHMPLPASMRPRAGALPLHTARDWGRLARLHMLDDRQYRSHQACAPARRGGGSTRVERAACAELDAPGRSLLGAEQETWLDSSLADSPAAWNLVGQQTLVAPFADLRNGRHGIWTDGWDGYPAARRRLMQSLARARNPVVFGGDVHSFHVADLHLDPEDRRTPLVAAEFVATSVTSQGNTQTRIDAIAALHPHMKLADARYRGYLRVRLTPHRMEAELRALRNVSSPDAVCDTLASFAVEDGKPGARRI